MPKPSNSHKQSFGIVSSGMYLPPDVLTNSDLEKIVDTSDEWITTRTGIKKRHVADSKTATSDIATEAAWRALENAKMKPGEIDVIILATATADRVFPATACVVQENLKAKSAACFDVAAACSGYLYGLTIAHSFLTSNLYNNVLVIGAETLTKIMDFQDRTTCVLFGDGAGASVIGRVDDGKGILSTFMKSDGSLTKILNMPAGGTRMPTTHETVEKRLHYIKMQGNEMFKFATRAMVEASNIAIKRAGLTTDDIDLFIPHQANIRIMEASAKRLHLPMDKVYVNIDRYGNTSAASIPIAIVEALDEGRINDGTVILLAAAGGGMTSAASVIRW
ncbi:MAG: beta-ketoacyl-ACP synthase III [Candidatus Glassbacteria bacterium]